MSQLDRVPMLLSDSGSRWRSLRATGREWRHEVRLRQAFTRGLRPDPVTSEAAAPPAPVEREERWSVWIERPGRWRAEFVVGGATVVVVAHDHTWWNWTPAVGARTNAGRRNSHHGAGPSEALIETALLPSAFRFELIGEGRWRDRTVLQVRAIPLSIDTPHVSLLQHRLGAGADEHILAVDAERGVLLRTEARRGGEPFRVVEMTAVAFDEDLPAGTFEIELPPGVAFADSEPAVHFKRRRWWGWRPVKSAVRYAAYPRT